MDDYEYIKRQRRNLVAAGKEVDVIPTASERARRKAVATKQFKTTKANKKKYHRSYWYSKGDLRP